MEKPPVTGAVFLYRLTMVSQSDLLAFARSLPEGLAFTPILGGKKPDHSYEPHPGKFHKGLADLDLAIRQGHTDYTAIGLWCGPHSRLAIFDVDANLAMTLEQFGDDLAKAPCVTSPKKNAAKYLFLVSADENMDSLHSVSTEASGKGFEVLWGKGFQGVVYGDYPANDHSEGGESYELHGDLSNIPPAPGWMLALMRKAKEDHVATGGVLSQQIKYGGAWRPLAYKRNIIEGCLGVIPPDQSYRDWIHVGMAIHHTFPTDEGLEYWRAWSKRTTHPEHQAQWERGDDPCAEKWATFGKKSGGKQRNLGNLIAFADEYDKNRERFTPEMRERMQQDEEIQKDSFEDIIKQLDTIYNHIEDPAMADFELEQLRSRFPRCDRSFFDNLYITHMQHKQMPPRQTGADFLAEEFLLDYIIPDMFYAPSVVMIHAAPGEGKTQAALAIGKTIMRSTDISIRGRKMPVAGGTLLIAQNDQNNMVMQEMLVQHGFTKEDDFVVRNGFNLRDRAGTIELLSDVKPRFVVIDSLSACSVGSPHSENAKEFADPLYFLAKANGTLFPACCIFVVHHSNKNGGHRGTSAITAAVDEVIKLRLPDEEEIRVMGPDARILNFEKSRSGRGGTHLQMTMNADLSFTLSDPQRPAETPRTSRIETIQVKILAVLRDAYPHDLTTWEIAEQTRTADGSIRPNLARMLKRGLIARGPDRSMQDAHGRTQKTSSYLAVLSSHITTTDVAPLPLEPKEDDPREG
jgi:hypothetical protein